MKSSFSGCSSEKSFIVLSPEQKAWSSHLYRKKSKVFFNESSEATSTKKNHTRQPNSHSFARLRRKHEDLSLSLSLSLTHSHTPHTPHSLTHSLSNTLSVIQCIIIVLSSLSPSLWFSGVLFLSLLICTSISLSIFSILFFSRSLLKAITHCYIYALPEHSCTLSLTQK